MKEIMQNGTISGFPDPAVRVVRKESNFESLLCGLSPPVLPSLRRDPRLYLWTKRSCRMQPHKIVLPGLNWSRVEIADNLGRCRSHI
jgi:hypothetical protein